MATEYRVVYEFRHKKICSCCTDETHPWKEVIETGFSTYESADKRTDELYGYESYDDERYGTGTEYKHITIQKAEMSWEDCFE